MSVADRQIVGHVVQPSPFCPNIAATPDGRQVWLTLKDVGKAVVFEIENGDSLTAIDTLTNKVIADVPIGQAPQAVSYVPNAVPEGNGTQGLQPLGVAGEAAHLALAPPKEAGATGASTASAPTSVSLFDQGLSQVLQASATGLQPRQPYVLALADHPDGSGTLQPLASFMTNPAGAAIVNAIGPIRQIVEVKASTMRRYLVIASGSAAHPGSIVQVQVP